MKIVFYDTETSGLPIRKYEYGRLYITQPYIVQLAWLVYDTDTEAIEKNIRYVKLNNSIHISEKSTEIHGITRELLEVKGKHIIDVLNDFRHTTKNCDLFVAHNVTFDKHLIEEECRRNELECVFDNTKSHHCTMKSNIERCGILKQYKGKPSFKYPTLLELHNHLFPNDKDIKEDQLHNAYNDVLLTFRCYFQTTASIDVKVKHPNMFLSLYY